MYKIEFNNDTTLEGLLESFKNLKDCGINGYVEIDGVKIYESDSNLEKKLVTIFKSKKLNKSTRPIKAIKIRKNQSKEETVYKEIAELSNCWNLSNNEVFKYYIGISLKYIKEEYREDLKKYYIHIYSDDKFEISRDLHLLANILLLLEYRDVFTIQEKLNTFFLNISKDDIEKLGITLGRIEKYGINGSKIKQCFYRDILDKDVENTRKALILTPKKKKQVIKSQS